MRFYVTEARSWATSSRDAYRIAQEDGSDGEYRPIEVPTNKNDLLDFLYKWCGPIVGAPAAPTSDEAETPPATAAALDLTFRTELAECWDSLPLPFCLDLAALALDRARAALPAPSDHERTH